MRSKHKRVSDLERSNSTSQEIIVLWRDNLSGTVFWSDRSGKHEMSQAEYDRLYPDRPGDIVIQWDEGIDVV